MSLPLQKDEVKRLWELAGAPPDTAVTMENLFGYGVKKLQPIHRLKHPDSTQEWMKIEFLYHHWDADCYIRFSEQERYYGAGDDQGGRDVIVALARAILQALEALVPLKKGRKSVVRGEVLRASVTIGG